MKLASFFIFFSLIYSFYIRELKANTLSDEINNLLKSYENQIDVKLYIRSLSSLEMSYYKSEDAAINPQGMNKIFLSAAALELLGPDYVFETNVYSFDKIDLGVLKGGLVFKGSGDPSFKIQDLQALIDQIKRGGIKEIHGDIFIDKTEFDDVKYGPGSSSGCLSKPSYAVEAILLNRGLAEIEVRPAEIAMMSPYIDTSKVGSHLCIENDIIMANIEKSDQNPLIRKKGSNENPWYVLEGVMPIGSKPCKFELPLKNPSLVLSQQIQSLLKKNQIKHEGKIVFGKKEGTLHLLASHQSLPLHYLIRSMVKKDDDFFADCILKKGGRVRFGEPGSWPSGSQLIREFILKTVGKIEGPLIIVDGSGSSRFNQVSLKTIGDFLYQYEKKSDYYHELATALSLSGIDGSLRKRFKTKSLNGKFRGYHNLSGVDSLMCGYLKGANGEMIVLALNTKIKKGFDQDLPKQLEDKLCDILYMFKGEK